jgi:hypothetical protein
MLREGDNMGSTSFEGVWLRGSDGSDSTGLSSGSVSLGSGEVVGSFVINTKSSEFDGSVTLPTRLRPHTARRSRLPSAQQKTWTLRRQIARKLARKPLDSRFDKIKKLKVQLFGVSADAAESHAE